MPFNSLRRGNLIQLFKEGGRYIRNDNKTAERRRKGELAPCYRGNLELDPSQKENGGLDLAINTNNCSYPSDHRRLDFDFLRTTPNL